MKYILFFLFFVSFRIIAQESIKDTLVIPDSLTIEKSDDDIDAIVFIESDDSLYFFVEEKKLKLIKNAKVEYKNTTLNAGEIISDFDTQEIEAFGITDSSDSNIIGTPILSEDGEIYEGSSLKYNFKTKKGFISYAKNKIKDGTYSGVKVKKVSSDIYFIEDGIYTPCEGEPPPTYFSAKEMKVIQNDKIFARWIFMYIAGIPLPVPLPFGVFPNQSGRRSGIIIPTYGTDANRGQYFRNFGYYWAASDYFDVALGADYFFRGGFGIRNSLRYNKRYDFQGNLSADYSKIIIGEEDDSDREERTNWNLRFNHNHDFSPTLKLNVNLSFQSSSYFQDTQISYDELLRRAVYSRAELNKRWDESNNSLSLSYERNQQLDEVNTTEYLPNVRFSMMQKYPFKPDGKKSFDNWYEYIGVKYDAQFQNRKININNIIDNDLGVQHNINISASPKLGYISISPTLNYTEFWYNKYSEKINLILSSSLNSNPDSLIYYDSLATNTINDFNFIRQFSFGVSANTKLYGILPINNFGINAFRHTISPSISYNFRPDFSDEFWGYYGTYIKSDGSKVKYDKYAGEIFGGVGSGESQAINFSLNNIFEMKTLKDPTDTLSKENKIQLLVINLSTGYNFAADSLKLNDIRINYRTNILDFLNFSGNSSYTFYSYESGKEVNKLMYSNNSGFLRIQNLSLSLQATLKGEARKESNENENDLVENNLPFSTLQDYGSIYNEKAPDFDIPWDLNLYFTYSMNAISPNNSIVNSSIRFDFSSNISPRWKIRFSGSYNLEKKEFNTPDLKIYRDMDCWEMNFQWRPTGIARGYFFQIRMKAPQLKDIKVEKSSDFYSGRY